MRTETYSIPMRRFDSGGGTSNARLLVGLLFVMGIIGSGYVMAGLVMAGVAACIITVGRVMADFVDWWGAVGEMMRATGQLLVSISFLVGSIGFLVLLVRL